MKPDFVSANLPELGLDDVNYISQTIGDFLRMKHSKRVSHRSPATNGRPRHAAPGTGVRQ